MVKRYEYSFDEMGFDCCSCSIQEHKDGDYVLYEDYEKLEKENESTAHFIIATPESMTKTH
jgi:hypothetical protein